MQVIPWESKGQIADQYLYDNLSKAFFSDSYGTE